MNRLAIAALCGALLLAGCEPSPGQLRTRGITEFQLGRPDQARQYFQTLLDRYPSDPDALYYMGRICYIEGQYELASYYYRCCLDADPSYKAAEAELPLVEEKLAAARRETGGL